MPRIRLLVAIALALRALPSLASDPAPSQADSRAAQAAALRALVDGNARFVEGQQAPHDLGAARRRELAKGQHPRAAILSCSDSRVPPEHVLDQQLGEIFVVRTAGNVADGVALGSLEYAVEHLGVPVIVVLGHRSCGAVAAAVAARRSHARTHGNLGEVLARVMPAVAEAEREVARTDPHPDIHDAAVDANVEREARLLVQRSPVIAGMVKSGRVRIVTAVYDLDTGKVEVRR